MRNSSQKLWLSLAVASSLFALPNCSGGQKGDPNNRGDFHVLEISTGATPIYPYRVRKVDSFNLPTNEILEINQMSDLKDNANGNNLVLPTGIFSEGPPKLPSGDPGNHFIKVRYRSRLNGHFDVSPVDGIETASENCDSLFQGVIGGFDVVWYKQGCFTCIQISS